MFPDSKADVRALSFFIDVQPGVLGPEATRLDYSMNSATTFPMNDAHAFAVFEQIRTPTGPWGVAKALLSMSLRDQWICVKTAFLALGQGGRVPRLAYQQLRYWSNVPFRQGTDAAVKYCATPDSTNPAHALQDGFNCLQDELTRHVNEDERMSAFDFALQFLDAERMTSRGRRRDASFWIENASIEWKEEEAPFHVVGRLRLLPKSVLSPETTNAVAIDVTEHSTPDCRPLGSINRARWYAESASRKARLDGVVEMPAPVPVRRSWPRSLLRWAVLGGVGVLALILAAGIGYRWTSGWYTPPLEHVDEVFYLDQGWGAQADSPARDLYYYTPQGAQLNGIRYSWFINLQRPFRSSRLADPDHLRQLNFLVDPFPTRSNPDQLPVGFARQYDETLHDYVLDVTCAACHTGQLNVKRPDGRMMAIRIDGGQAMHAFTGTRPGGLLMEAGLGLITTFGNPFKFNRFARNVLGADAGMWEKFRLWREVGGVVGVLGNRVLRGSFASRLAPTEEGFGRIDAVTRISNVVFGDGIDRSNYRPARGPASLPYVWNIWKFDWVQYGGFVSQPMARNMGEVMGTGAEYRLLDDFGRPIPPAERYRTSIAFDNLQRIESTLQTLKPPPWPEALLGKIDHESADRGKDLFEAHCVGCHGPHVAADALTHAVGPGRGPADPLWVIRVKALADVGTDPAAATDLVGIRVDLTRSGLETAEVKRLLLRELETKKARAIGLVPALEAELKRKKQAGAPQATLDEIETEVKEASARYGNADEQIVSLDKLDLRSVSIGEGLTILGMTVRERYYADNHFSEAAKACFDGFGTLDLPQAIPGYKPRPLEGVWATPPFLHNGSVPTLYDLLSPVEERPTTFYLGTREFDPLKVGYVTKPAFPGAGGFWFDTTKEGNRNIGHEFRKGYVPFDDEKPAEAQYQGGVIGPEFTPQQRKDLVEYLKVRQDEPPPPARVPPDCFALLKGAAAGRP
jgi:mono/diheme cytochrome c family protein